MIRVLVNGASGKMGVCIVAAIKATTDLKLVASCNSKDDLEKELSDSKADVAIDFTSADAVFTNTQQIIKQGVHPVIGTSGLTPTQIDALTQACAAKKLGGIFAPNFAVGAVLMIKYAEDAARYFCHGEIIEMHHDQKKDKPSGTAAHTQQRLEKHIKHVPIHSVRLPGLLAHQEIMFGAKGELLTLRHDTTDRQCMMPGILLACRRVQKLAGFVVGLEHIMQ